jgi:hypothetical protein
MNRREVLAGTGALAATAVALGGCWSGVSGLTATVWAFGPETDELKTYTLEEVADIFGWTDQEYLETVRAMRERNVLHMHYYISEPLMTGAE